VLASASWRQQSTLGPCTVTWVTSSSPTILPTLNAELLQLPLSQYCGCLAAGASANRCRDWIAGANIGQPLRETLQRLPGRDPASAEADGLQLHPLDAFRDPANNGTDVGRPSTAAWWNALRDIGQGDGSLLPQVNHDVPRVHK